MQYNARMNINTTLSLPHNCYVILTSRCNLRCLHCYGNYGVNVPKKELTGEQWGDVFKKLTKSGVFYLNISGGEPTCHPDFDLIIKALIDNQQYFMLTTNGICSDKTLSTIALAKDYLLGVSLSLDGPNPNSHGFIRKSVVNKSSEMLFEQTVEAIKFLIRSKIRVSIATCLHVKNIHVMDKMTKLVLDLRPINWAISTISISGRARSNSSIFVSESELPTKFWNRLKKTCKAHKVTVEFIDMPSLVKTKEGKKLYYQCPAARWFCEINSDGLVTPCPLTRVNPPSNELVFENILEKPISEIWNSSAFETFRSYQTRGCEGCVVRDKCGRCPPQSMQWFKDPLMPTPYCIIHGKLLGLKNLSLLEDKLRGAICLNGRENYITHKGD